MDGIVGEITLWPPTEQCYVCRRFTAWHRLTPGDHRHELWYCFDHCPGKYEGSREEYERQLALLTSGSYHHNPLKDQPEHSPRV